MLSNKRGIQAQCLSRTNMAKEFWIGDVQAGAHDGAEVELKGWIKRSRGSNKIRFVVLRDSLVQFSVLLSAMQSVMNPLNPSRSTNRSIPNSQGNS